MTRVLLSGFGGVVVGVAAWFVVGFPAAFILGQLPGWQREGEGAMTGMFFIGPIAGLVGLISGTWMLWRFTAAPARHGQVALALTVLLAAMVATGAIVMMPKRVASSPTPGRILVEVKLPSSVADGKDIVFQMRSAGQFEETPANLSGERREGSFPLGSKSGAWIFAVMSGDRQVDVVSLELPFRPALSTDWVPFRTMDSGAEMRWRIFVDK